MSSESYGSPPRRPSAKALGKRRADVQDDVEEQAAEEQAAEEQNTEEQNTEEQNTEEQNTEEQNTEEQHGEQGEEENIDESQLELEGLPARAPAPGLATTAKFQAPAHPEHLSPFEKVMLNNQRLILEVISGISAKVDYLMTTSTGLTIVVFDSTRGRTPRSSLGSARGRPSSTSAARATATNAAIVAELDNIVENQYAEVLRPVLAAHTNAKGKNFVMGSGVNQINASNAYFNRLRDTLGEASEEWTSFGSMSEDTRMTLFFKVCKKWREANKAASAAGAASASGTAGGAEGEEGGEGNEGATESARVPSSDNATAASSRPRRHTTIVPPTGQQDDDDQSSPTAAAPTRTTTGRGGRGRGRGRGRGGAGGGASSAATRYMFLDGAFDDDFTFEARQEFDEDYGFDVKHEHDDDEGKYDLTDAEVDFKEEFDEVKHNLAFK
ncbi:uncharacterized protein M437DRAFT_62030 [Aureobasidium melanogenum CBS 110374]|uniref:Uncharacterized protein n=1 Tax=Aureobasidium melanogenum (strain CBS 110374) TaxID=1043003 RepID=A0A074W490_AURM1|nr:uncharacterized protein M437DRAFT_62030 [Aureobasidium melanogenum CBS 110374]KEQ67643.1 hypothetical protein M437DRAFT_62030 [Aureobasidium melanogenum CBS 110374]